MSGVRVTLAGGPGYHIELWRGDDHVGRWEVLASNAATPIVRDLSADRPGGLDRVTITLTRGFRQGHLLELCVAR